LRPYLDRVLTHNGLTDAFLAALASLHGARLVTFDQSLKRLYDQSIELPEV
jgi:predicted nucleic acid-binding protein